MQKKQNRAFLPYILCMILMTAMALFTTGCTGSTKNAAPPAAGSEAGTPADDAVLGEGSTKFTFTVTDNEGSETQFEIHTDKETVGEALAELGMIAGDESEYGLYVKTVNGITADYDTDGTYWAFYINGEYAQTGVDSTKITEGDTYSFKIEK